MAGSMWVGRVVLGAEVMCHDADVAQVLLGFDVRGEVYNEMQLLLCKTAYAAPVSGTANRS